MQQRAGGKRKMVWIMFALGAVLSWGFYGVALHKGQVELGSPLKALLCVVIAYFLIAVLVPVGGLAGQGQLKGFPKAAEHAALFGECCVCEDTEGGVQKVRRSLAAGLPAHNN